MRAAKAAAPAAVHRLPPAAGMPKQLTAGQHLFLSLTMASSHLCIGWYGKIFSNTACDPCDTFLWPWHRDRSPGAKLFRNRTLRANLVTPFCGHGSGTAAQTTGTEAGAGSRTGAGTAAAGQLTGTVTGALAAARQTGTGTGTGALPPMITTGTGVTAPASVSVLARPCAMWIVAGGPHKSTCAAPLHCGRWTAPKRAVPWHQTGSHHQTPRCLANLEHHAAGLALTSAQIANCRYKDGSTARRDERPSSARPGSGDVYKLDTSRCKHVHKYVTRIKEVSHLV